MATINDILTMPRFSDLKLLNHGADASRVVDTIEISETPDVSGYLPKNSLLLTTAMSYETNPLALIDLISSLNNLPTAGLAIKLGRFISEIPTEVIAYADKIRFPLIQIPMSYTLGEISQQLLSYIWNDHTEAMYFALDIQRKFSNLMMKGASIDSLTNHLSSLIKRPLFLIDSFGEIQSTSRSFPVSEVLTENELKEIILEIQGQSNKNQKISYLKELKKNDKLLITIFPITTNSFSPNYLVILKENQFAYPFSQLAIEQAISVLSHTLYRDQIIMLNRLSKKQEFLQSITNGNEETEWKITTWLDYGKPFGMVKSHDYRAITGRVFLPENLNYYQKDIIELIYGWFSSHISDLFKAPIFFAKSDIEDFTIFIQHKEREIQDKLTTIHQFFYEQLGIKIVFAIGTNVELPHLLKFSYHEANKILLKTDKISSTICYFFENHGIESLVENMSEKDINYFCTTVLKSLATPMNDNDFELRRTLTVFLNNQCRITETAEELFVHRNTVKYRIAKCNELFDNKIDNPELSLQLRVALLLSENSNSKP